MVWFAIIVGLVALGVFFFKGTKQKGDNAPVFPSEGLRTADTFTPRDPAPSQHGHPKAPGGPNILQPYSPIPLTVEDGSPEQVASLREILNSETHGRGRVERILVWLISTNARIKEVDEFVAEWGPKFRAVVDDMCRADPDWALASELDREDIRAEARLEAADRLEVHVEELNYEVIAEPPSLPASADDDLLARFGFEALSFYLRHAGDLDRVHVIPSGDYYRPRFDKLVETGLAKRGADIASESVLQPLTLKEMEAVAEGVEHRRFTRRAPAIEFLSGLPDLRERLGRHVSFREMFQLLPLPVEFSALDLVAVGHAWSYASEYAKLIERTYATAAQAQEALTTATQDEYAKGWMVEASFGGTPCCPACAKQAGKRKIPPSLPHHVGCSCYLSQIYA